MFKQFYAATVKCCNALFGATMASWQERIPRRTLCGNMMLSKIPGNESFHLRFCTLTGHQPSLTLSCFLLVCSLSQELSGSCIATIAIAIVSQKLRLARYNLSQGLLLLE